MTTEKTGVSVSKGEMKTDICSTGSASQKKKVRSRKVDLTAFCFVSFLDRQRLRSINGSSAGHHLETDRTKRNPDFCSEVTMEF